MRYMLALSIVASLSHRILAGTFAAQFDEQAFAPEDIIHRDVAIIGGGASGTYAAVRLQEDFNTSVIVIEKQDHLGGHVNSYIDPVSGTILNYGVQVYLRYGNATAFFEGFDIPISNYEEPVTPRFTLI